MNPVEKPGVATPVTLDAYTLTDHIFDSSVDTDDLGDITMEENDAIQLHEPIHLGEQFVNWDHRLCLGSV